jgi:hypothetical protein
METLGAAAGSMMGLPSIVGGNPMLTWAVIGGVAGYYYDNMMGAEYVLSINIFFIYNKINIDRFAMFPKRSDVPTFNYKGGSAMNK